MEDILWQQILNYGALGVLTIIFFLFARGYIVSQKSLQDVMTSHKETVSRIADDNTKAREAYERTLDKMITNHNKTVDLMCKSFQDTITEMKEIIDAVKGES